MYQNGCNCNNGLGFITELVSAFTGSVGAGTSTAPASSTTVSPQISTQISPQISPVFQQQFQPTNSAATAGTAQSVPQMPAMVGDEGVAPGAMPLGPGYAMPSPAMPAVPQVGIDWVKFAPYVLAGLGILAFVAVKKRKPS